MSKSLYERLGGEAAVEAAVLRFYDKVLADPRLQPFFATLDMDKQIHKQVSFMTMAFGGPHQYTGRDMKSAHATLVRKHGLGDEHFDAVAGHLQATLEELKIAPDLIGEVMTIVGSTRDDVLGRS